MTTKDSESSAESLSGSGPEKIRAAMVSRSKLVATVRKTVTQSSFLRSSPSGAPTNVTGLLDGTGDGEDREVHRDEEATDHDTEEHHHDRLDHRRQTGHGRV